MQKITLAPALNLASTDCELDCEPHDLNIDIVIIKQIYMAKNPAPGDPDYDLPPHTD